MCLVGLRHGTDSRHALVLVANRDEFHARPAEGARFWDDAPNVLAGRDLEAGGTWLGVTRAGRFATVTNVREPPGERRKGAPSRGGLVRDFLVGATSPQDHAESVLARIDAYDGVNLLVGDGDEIAFVSSIDRKARVLPHGDYGLSNGALDAPWPKVRHLKDGLEHLDGTSDPDPYFALLGDRREAPDDELPDTGVGLAMERFLAPAFLVGPVYGTRASTVVMIDRDGVVRFVERAFAAGGVLRDERRYDFVRNASSIASSSPAIP